jgi:hypothetical protein
MRAKLGTCGFCLYRKKITVNVYPISPISIYEVNSKRAWSLIFHVTSI